VSRSAAEWTQADCPSPTQTATRPRTSDQQRPGLSACVRERSEVDTGGLSLLESKRNPTKDHRPTTSGTVPCVPKRSGGDTGGLSRFDLNHPLTTDQRPRTSNVRDCPQCPEAQRGGHRGTVPPRIKTRLTSDQRPRTSDQQPPATTQRSSLCSAFSTPQRSCRRKCRESSPSSIGARRAHYRLTAAGRHTIVAILVPARRLRKYLTFVSPKYLRDGRSSCDEINHVPPKHKDIIDVVQEHTVLANACLANVEVARLQSSP